MINQKSNVRYWSNANDFHWSRGPTLRGLARDFYDPSIEEESQLSYRGSTLEDLRAFIGVETAALTFRTKQYSTSYSSHICYGKRFYNDFFLNHNTIALMRNCLKLLSCVVIETALDGIEKGSIILTVSFPLENVPFNIKSYRFECKDCNACSQTIMTHHLAFGYSRKG